MLYTQARLPLISTLPELLNNEVTIACAHLSVQPYSFLSLNSARLYGDEGTGSLMDTPCRHEATSCPFATVLLSLVCLSFCIWQQFLIIYQNLKMTETKNNTNNKLHVFLMDKNDTDLRRIELSLASRTGSLLLFSNVQFYLKSQLEGFLCQEF